MPNGYHGHHQPGWSTPYPQPLPSGGGSGNGYQQQISDLRERMATLEERSTNTQARLAIGDRRLEAIDGRFNLMSGRLGEVEADLRQQMSATSKLEILHAQVEKHESRLDVIEARRQLIGRLVTWAIAIAAPLLALAGKVSWGDALGVLGRMFSHG